MKMVESLIQVRKKFRAMLKNKWAILISACAVNAINGGFFLSFGVLFVDILEMFGAARAEVASIQSVQSAVTYCSGFVIGFLVNRYKPRRCGCAGCFIMTVAVATSYFAPNTAYLIVIIGAIGGIANTLFMLSAMSAVSLNFVGSTQKVVLAVTVAAGSIGGVPYPYLLRYVCDNFGLQWTFLIAGLAVSVTIFLALLWSIPEKTFETRTQNGHNATVIGDNNKDTTHDSFTAIISDKAKYHKSICNSQTCQTNTAVLPSEIENWRAVLRVLVCNVPFILFIVGQALAGSTFRVLSTILTDVLRERGFSSKESTVAFMVFNFTGIPGRLLTGVIEKIPRGSSLILVSSLTLIASPAVIGMNFVSNHVLAILACGTGGLAFGAVHASIAVSTISLVKEQHYSPAVGIAYGLTGIIVAITGPLSGSIRDSSSSYIAALSILSGAVLAGSLLYCISFLLKRRKVSGQLNLHSLKPEGKGIKSILHNRWIVLTCACAVLMIGGGFFLSFGVLFVDLLEEFGESRAQTATVQLIHFAVVNLASFFVGFIVNRYDTRLCGCAACFVTAVAVAVSYFAQSITFLIVSIGTVGGLIMSFILLSGIKTVSHTFEGTTQNIALSVLLTMPIVGGVPYPYLLRYLSDTFEIHLTFLIVGCLIGITMPITLTWYIPKQRQNIMETQQEVPNRENDIHENGEPSVNRYETMDAVPDEDTNNATTENVITTIELSCDNRVFSHMITSNKDDPDGQNIDTRRNTSQQIMTTQPLKTRETKNWRMILKILLTNVPFVLFVFGHAFASSSLRVLATILTDVLRDRGLTSTETTVALMIYNFSGIPGRLLVGLVKKIPRGSSFILVVALTVFATPALIGLCFVNNMGSSAILCSLCGLAFGAVHASNGVTVPSLVGTDDSTPAIGLSWGVTGIFIAITGPLGGSIRDSATSYTATLSILSGAVLSGSLLYLLSFLIKRRKAKMLSKTLFSMEINSKEPICTLSTRL